MSEPAVSQLAISQPVSGKFSLSVHRATLERSTGVLKKIQGWMLAHNTRYQLRHLNARQLNDIGLTSADRECLFPDYPSQGTGWARI